MRIYVDADALPAEAKRILFRAAERVQVSLCLVANRPMKVPDSPLFENVVVEDGFNRADDWIVEQVQKGDMVITADIPLAHRVVKAGGSALDPRGDLYTEEGINERLALRNLMDDLRGANVVTSGGPAPFNKKDVHRFASRLNAFLSTP